LLRPDDGVEAAAYKIGDRDCRRKAANPFFDAVENDVVLLLGQMEKSPLRFHEG